MALRYTRRIVCRDLPMRLRPIAVVLLAIFAFVLAFWVARQTPSAPAKSVADSSLHNSAETMFAAANARTTQSLRQRGNSSARPAQAPLPPRDTPLGTIYDELAARARSGDTSAAMRLVLDLQRCRYRQSTSESFSIVSNRLQSAATQDPKTAPSLDEIVVTRDLDNLDKTQAACADISVEQIDQRGQWLRMAAQDGDAEAMVCYAAAPFDFGPKFLSDAWFDWATQWRTDAPQFAAQAFAAGQADVIALLQDAYSAGTVMPGMRLTMFRFGELVTPDRTLAYAYSLLYLRVVSQNTLSSAQNRVESAQAALNAEQIAHAHALADAAWPRFAAQAGEPGNTLPCRELLFGTRRE